MKTVFNFITSRKALVSAALVSVGYAFGVNPEIIRAITDVFALTF